MQLSDKGLAFLVAHEGVVPALYLDSKNIPTFGIGHTASAGPPNPSQMAKGMPPDLNEALEYAFQVFRRDLAKFETIKKFWIADEPLTIEAGLLTSSLKLRRKAVYQRYRDRFEALYG